MNLNTDYVINEYEHGTASLSRRFEAIKKLLDTNKYLVDLSIEPFLLYENYEAEYRMLMERIKQEIDISDVNLKTIKFGGVRYRRALATEIQKNHPSTTLFADIQKLVDPTGTDERLRYPVDLRVKMYKMFIDTFQGNRDKLILGCEFSDIWKMVGLDWIEHIANFVCQYDQANKHLCP
jgi:DNA repair photolyase